MTLLCNTVASVPRDLAVMSADPGPLRLQIANPAAVSPEWIAGVKARQQLHRRPGSTASTRAGAGPKASRRMEALRLSVRLLSELTRAIGEGRHDDASRARQALTESLRLVDRNR